LLGAALRSLNDELNSGLVCPTSKLFDTENLELLTDADHKLLEDLDKRYEEMKGKETVEHEAIHTYAQSIVSESQIFNRVKDIKKSTLMAFADGGCDTALANQLHFLFEWLNAKHQNLLYDPDLQPGPWHISQNRCKITQRNTQKKFTAIERSRPKQDGEALAIQPTLRDPMDLQSLNMMRRAMQEYLMRHVEGSSCGFHDGEWNDDAERIRIKKMSHFKDG
jgi:hypothetical protein